MKHSDQGGERRKGKKKDEKLSKKFGELKTSITFAAAKTKSKNTFKDTNGKARVLN